MLFPIYFLLILFIMYYYSCMISFPLGLVCCVWYACPSAENVDFKDGGHDGQGVCTVCAEIFFGSTLHPQISLNVTALYCISFEM